MGRRAFLDTHVAIWLATGDKRLSKSALKEINRLSEVVISAISVAELELKASIGKVSGPSDWAAMFTQNGIQVEAFDARAASQLARFAALHRHDPFDAMILAQASARLGTTFFNADEALVDLGLDWVYNCR